MLWKGVTIKEKSGDNLIVFDVKGYSVIFSKAKGSWVCSCSYKSFWGINKGDCSHIKSAKMYLGRFEVN